MKFSRKCALQALVLITAVTSVFQVYAKLNDRKRNELLVEIQKFSLKTNLLQGKIQKELDKGFLGGPLENLYQDLGIVQDQLNQTKKLLKEFDKGRQAAKGGGGGV